MYKCNICHCYCDPGELHGGVCDDCVEEAMEEERRREEAIMMRRRYLSVQQDGQLVMVL